MKEIKGLLKGLIKSILNNIRYFHGAEISYYGVKLKLSRTIVSKAIAFRIYKNKYEVNEMKIIDASLTSSDIVMELGTGIGFIALFCAKRVAAKQVYTFEANPLLIPHIKENFRINNQEINLFNSILKHKPIERACDFYISKDFYSSGLTRPKYFDRTVQVSVIDFEAELNRIQPSFLIVDIEGYEYELFKELILPSVVKKILIELHPEKTDSFVDIIGNFKNMGFTINESYLELNQLYGER